AGSARRTASDFAAGGSAARSVGPRSGGGNYEPRRPRLPPTPLRTAPPTGRRHGLHLGRGRLLRPNRLLRQPRSLSGRTAIPPLAGRGVFGESGGGGVTAESRLHSSG